MSPHPPPNFGHKSPPLKSRFKLLPWITTATQPFLDSHFCVFLEKTYLFSIYCTKSYFIRLVRKALSIYSSPTPPQDWDTNHPNQRAFSCFCVIQAELRCFFLQVPSVSAILFGFFDKRCYVLNLTTSSRVLLKYCWILILLRNTQFVWCIITKTKVVSSLTFFVYLNDFKTHQFWGII